MWLLTWLLTYNHVVAISLRLLTSLLSAYTVVSAVANAVSKEADWSGHVCLLLERKGYSAILCRCSLPPRVLWCIVMSSRIKSHLPFVISTLFYSTNTALTLFGPVIQPITAAAASEELCYHRMCYITICYCHGYLQSAAKCMCTYITLYCIYAMVVWRIYSANNNILCFRHILCMLSSKFRRAMGQAQW